MAAHLILLFIALVFAQDDTVELVEENLIGARYDEDNDRHRNLFSVERLDDKTFGLDAILQARMFTNTDGEIYIGTSMYNNYVTYRGNKPLLKWNSDDETFEEVSVHPELRGGLDAQNAVNYFTTIDGTTWAYDSLYAIQNSTERSFALIGGNGTSYILKLDGDEFSATPAFSFFTNFSTSRSEYFVTADNREFLWTFSWGPANAPAPVPGARTPILSDIRGANPQRCTLIEYKSGTWSIVASNTDSLNFIGCPSRPRSPISFKNVEGNWVYFFPSFGGGGVLTLNYRGATLTPQWEGTNNVLDNFGIPDADFLYHWVDVTGDESTGVSHDMITATSAAGIRTYRLHWNIHYAEELPMVPVPQGTPYDFSWFLPGDRRCFVVGSANYPGLRDVSPPAILNYYLSIYCWDQSRDTWDLAIRFPAEWTWFNQVFQDPENDDENIFYLVTFSRAHLTNVKVQLYKLEVLDDDDVHIRFNEAPSLSVADATAKDVHENRHIVIATLSFVCFITLVVLLLLFLNMGKGGGGGSSDYSSFG